MSLKGVKVGFALTGSFCTFEKAFKAAQALIDTGAEVFPIMSFNAASISTRFGTSDEHVSKLEEICGHKVIKKIEDAEPIGPKKMFDILIIAPCTANTIAKLALGITDGPVTMAAKSHLRNGSPVVIAISTNDALAGCAKNIGILQNYRNYFFVPYTQDNYNTKPNSIVSDFDKIEKTLEQALKNRQLQPVFISIEN